MMDTITETLASIAARVLANEGFRETMTATEVRTAGGEIMKIHPSLNIIPLMDKDEMKKNGLRMPIIVDASGVLIDGRCRLMACELAGIPPRFRTLPEGEDPLSWIYSTNISRQSRSKSQIAISKAWLETWL